MPAKDIRPTPRNPAAEPPPTGEYPPTSRTTPSRARERAHYDRALVHAILDEGYLCHLGFVRDGAPVVLPTLYGRIGERLYVHGSTGSRPLRAAAAPGGPGLPVCLTVTLVDALVLARSSFHHSANYRSVVVHGHARAVTDEDERARALDALVDQAVPGRSADCRPPSARESAATAVLGIDLAEVSAKVRAGGPRDEPEDLTLPHWSGLLPVHTVHGPPRPVDDQDPALAPPGYLTALARP